MNATATDNVARATSRGSRGGGAKHASTQGQDAAAPPPAIGKPARPKSAPTWPCPLATLSGDGRVSTVRLLLDRDADPNQRGEQGATPLMAASFFGRVEAAELLLERGADPHASSFSSGTALSAACCNGNFEIARLLLEHGADADHVHADTGESPLHIAAQRQDVDLARLLLNANADPGGARADNGHTPLFLACQTGRIDVVRLLLDGGADPNDAFATTTSHCIITGIEIRVGLTPLHVACLQGRSDIVQLLATFGADLFAVGRACDAGIAFLHTPSQSAGMMGHARLASWLDRVVSW